MKKNVLIVSSLAVLGLAGLGLHSNIVKADDSSTNPKDSLVQKLVDKFNLNKTEVEAVFDEQHQEMQAEREANAKEALADAVKDGDITQAQADHIQAARDEIKALIGDNHPRNLDDATKDKIHDKMDELRDWAKEQDIDLHDIGGGPGFGHGGRGHGGPF